MVHRGFTPYQHSACLPYTVAGVFTWMYCMFYVLITYRNTTPMHVVCSKTTTGGFINEKGKHMCKNTQTVKEL